MAHSGGGGGGAGGGGSYALLDEPETFTEWSKHQASLLWEDIRAWALYIYHWIFQHWPLGPIKVYPATESANFTVINNEKSRIEASNRKKKEGAWRTFLRWVSLLLLGVSVAALYQLVRGTIEYIDEWKYGRLHAFMQSGQYGLGWINHFGVMLALIVAAVLIALWEPMAAGGGVAEVVSFLNGARPSNLLTYRTFFAKAIGVTLSVGSGLFLGPEGPFIHLGSIAGARIPSLLYLLFQKVPVVGTALESLLSHSEERNFVVAGAAVGIASAFHAPIGGTMFVLEEALSFFDSKLIFRTYFTCATSYFTYKLLSEGHYLSTSSLAFSSPALQTTCYPGYAAVDLIMFAIMGIVGGLLGVVFNLIFIRAAMWRSKYIKRWGWRKLADVVVLAFATSLFVAFLPINYGCSPVTQLASHLAGFDPNDEATFGDATLYTQADYCIASTTEAFFLNYSSTEATVNDFLESKYLQTSLCPEGYYNELASLIQVNGHEAVTLLFASGAYNMFHAKAVAIFGVVYFFLCAVTTGLSAPAGIFVPSMTIGACLGRLLAIFTNTYVKYPLGDTPIDPGPWAMIGAAAFLCGSARITVTIAIIILEITGDFRYLPGIALAVVFAKTTGGFFTKSIYHMQIHLKDIPFLEDIPGSAMDNIFVRDIMTAPVIVVHHIESIVNLRRILTGCKHNGFPVVKLDSDDSEFKMPNLQDDLNLEPEERSRVAEMNALALALSESTKRVYVRLCGTILRDRLEAILAHAPSDNMLIDVTNQMNETPFTVQPDFTMSQAFRMFRTLGLRHLPVVDKNFEVQGIITRRNFLESHHHRPAKQTTYELKTMRLFMQPAYDPSTEHPRQRHSHPTRSLFADDVDLFGEEGEFEGDMHIPLPNGTTGTTPNEPLLTATVYTTSDLGETSV